ncbi:MAG: 2-phospho-L-lactate transferase [Anaerolineales bacterium]
MKILALAGGVGGAKLVDGLSRLDPSPELTVVTNTGDDFILFGLQICPDLDTVCYNLAGLENPLTGWGRAEESWESIDEISKLGGLDWFRLGNKDLAVHLERTRRLRAGETLSKITIDFCRSWGIQTAVLPMSDNQVSTIVQTNQGELSFQDYFVKLNCRPEVTGFYFKGAEDCTPAEGVIQSIKQADLVVICPSNPWVSIDPILAVPGIRQEMKKKIVLAISPIIGGKTVKGPAAKMYQEMGITPSAAAVAAHYGEFLAGFVMDTEDQDLEQDIRSSGSNAPKVFVTDTWMKTRQDRVKLAEKILNFAQQLIKEEG